MNTVKMVATGTVLTVAIIGCTGTDIVSASDDRVHVRTDSKPVVDRVSKPVVDRVAKSVMARFRSTGALLVKKGDFSSIKLTLSDAEIDEQILRERRSDEQMSFVDVENARHLVIADYEKFLTEEVYPAWAKFIVDSVRANVRELVAENRFEDAREVAWNASMTDSEQVNSLVRAECAEILRTDVNPVQWPLIEKELRDLAAKYDNDESLEAGRDAVIARRSERAYSRYIDKQLAAVITAAIRIGADKTKVSPVIIRTRELLYAAANLVDSTDDAKTDVTTNVVAKASSPNLSSYESELAKYREDLLKFDCTEEKADETVKAVDSIVRPLFSYMYTDAVTETDSKSTLRLGITALNNRIIKLKAELVADFDKRIAARDERKLNAKIAELRNRVMPLVDAGKFDEARECAWSAAAEDSNLRPAALEIIAVSVNPVHWEQVETEFAQKTNQMSEVSECDEALAWIRAYPKIRTYSREIDVRLDEVGQRACSLGVPATNVSEVVSAMRSLAEDVERLVNNTDAIKSDVQKAPFADKDLDDVLAAYRAALVRNDCTEVNADRLVKEARDRISRAFADTHAGVEKGYLILGCNAFNARLDKLIAAYTATLVAQKCDYVVDSLVECVVDLVKSGKFAEARKAIADVPQVNDVDCDARICSVRLGLLNSVVNPAQFVTSLKEINDMETSMLRADKCEELLKWIDDYSSRVSQDADLLKLGDSHKNLDESIFKPYLDAEDIGELIATINRELGELGKEHYAPLTTCEFNEKLSVRLLEAKDAVMKHRAFCDSQIALAEAAIAEQLNEKVPSKNGLQFNAVLGDYARAMRLRKLGSNLDSEALNSLMLGSVYLGSKSVLDCAIARGGKVNAVSGRDPLAHTPLLLAIQMGRTELVAQLLAAGAKPVAVDALGNGAIHYAVDRGSLDLVWLMMANGCDINLKNKSGETPLYAAVRKDQLAIVAALTKSSDPQRAVATVAVKNRNGETPFDVACIFGARESVDALVEAGASFGVEQLVLAVRNRRLSVVRWLVNHGVDVNAPGVMQAACDCSEVKKYLVSQGGSPLECTSSCCKPTVAPANGAYEKSGVEK